ncbi:putative protein phosphatase 2C 59, partial [Drosera capensis]
TEFLKSENPQKRDTGSTASTSILIGDRLLVAKRWRRRAGLVNAIAVSQITSQIKVMSDRIENERGFVM